jgi:Lon protease-like protein
MTDLPLFPLGTVLFPGGRLPLQIFEVRYLDLVGRCHREGLPFGVVSLIQGSEVRKASDEDQTPEVFQTIGTLARITSWQSPQPGLMRIDCLGEQRFKVLAQRKLKHGLWVGDIERLAADPVIPLPDDLAHVAQQLERLIQHLQTRGLSAEQFPIAAPFALDDCGWVANRWSELLPLPSAMKHNLLALDSPLMRLELIADFLEQT